MKTIPVKFKSLFTHNGWRAFIPHGIWLIGSLGVLWFFSIPFSLKVGYWAGFSLILFVLVGVWPERNWVHLSKLGPMGNPARNPKPDVVLVLGFGYERTTQGLTPGAANWFLAQWLETQEWTGNCLVQEGIWAAGTVTQRKNWQRMHVHVEGKYINTYEALHSAWKHPWVKAAKHVCVVAHDLQLARALWIAEQCAQFAAEGAPYLFAPTMPEVPMVSHPVLIQWHTRFRFVFACVERWWARPRDVLNVFKRTSIDI